METYKRRYIEPHYKYPTVLPHSEVCIQIGMAGRTMFIEWDGKRSVQLYGVRAQGGTGCDANDQFLPYSAPILPGEAGIYTDADGRLYQVLGHGQAFEMSMEETLNRVDPFIEIRNPAVPCWLANARR